MGPPDGVRAKRLPTMSWESVVDGQDEAAVPEVAAPPAVASTPESPPTAASAPIAPLVSPVGTGPITIEPITFAPLTLDLAPSPPTPPPPPPVSPVSNQYALDEPRAISFAPLAPIVSAFDGSVSDPVAPPPGADPAVAAQPATSAPVVAPAVVAPAVVAPAVVVPAVADAPAVPAPAAVVVSEPMLGLPEIVEATPIQESSSSDVVDVDAVGARGHGSSDLAGLATGGNFDAGPQLPRDPAPSRQPAPAMPFETTTVERPRNASGPQTSRRRGRRALKLVATLVVLAGLVAAGVVFGRPYLLPSDWDKATQPFADAVETARGVEFVESLSVIAEPTPQYTDRMSAELTGAWAQDQAMWRALGLMRGPATEENVAATLAGWQDAVYSSVDGQVYRDEAVAGPKSDAQITEAMATASLDQEFGWSIEQPNRTLDDAAQTRAEVIRQARDVLASSPFAVELEPVEPAALSLVPPVVGYRVLAPATFAEFERNTAGTENALAGIGTGGPGPIASEVPVVASNPTMTGTDVVVESPRAMDRSFWYLVFAGFLDPRTSYNASEAIVEGAVTIAERGATQCAYATFSGGDTEQTATLRAALEAWSAAASTTLSSTFSVLPDGGLQIVGCDPGVGFDTPTRLGVARELVGWRMAELATLESVAGAQGSAADLEVAWALVEASDVPVQLAALPPETTPQDAAAQARAAVGALLTPAG